MILAGIHSANIDKKITPGEKSLGVFFLWVGERPLFRKVIMEQVKWCGCMDVRSFKQALADLFSTELVDGKKRGELFELFEVKSFEEFRDELSDISWGVGRLIAGLFGKVYVRIPGDGIHYKKVVNRVEEYGCMRSKRFLVNGRCPSERNG
jgi:hypothetical protein